MPTQPLDYAPNTLPRDDDGPLRFALALFALLGLAFNLWAVLTCVSSLERAHAARRDLHLDPHAYGRTVPPETIAALRTPYALWLSAGALTVTATFGAALALTLGVAAALLRRRPNSARFRLKRYARWKPPGTFTTTVSLFWFSSANSSFWTAATRHGGLPPYPDWVSLLLPVLFILAALLPCWLSRLWLRDQDASYQPHSVLVP